MQYFTNGVQGYRMKLVYHCDINISLVDNCDI